MRELEYPFDSVFLLNKGKKIRRKLLEEHSCFDQKKIAILGGSTTHDVVRMLELFLLNNQIKPDFYESEYGQYWEDAMFENHALEKFEPDVIYIHTGIKNIYAFPLITDSENECQEKVLLLFERFKKMWEMLECNFHCVIIQNNFEYPSYRIMGNQEAYNCHGKIWFVNHLNELLYQYAAQHNNFYIQDINYLASCYGLDKWCDPYYWHMYKYALSMEAIPVLAHNLSNIIKSLYGKNKKALVLDLDNTLWGGIVGDDGVEGLEIGKETSAGQLFSEIQSYFKEIQALGIPLNIASKNELENAVAGLSHPDTILKPEDFVCIEANWEPKGSSIIRIAKELNILTESIVFIDDNPAEREQVRRQGKEIAVPELENPEHFIHALDRCGYFELTNYSMDDKKRNEMYQNNIKRKKEQDLYADYESYLLALEMEAEIVPFRDIYLSRIVQLINKSNQFNLTTKRYSEPDIRKLLDNKTNLALYGRLHDKFGDNGIVSVVIGEMEQDSLHINLWLMSCRVLKRNMEFAMMDQLIELCRKKDIKKVYGYYYPTLKNKMVQHFYAIQGFQKIMEDTNNNTKWELMVEDYKPKNRTIRVNDL